MTIGDKALRDAFKLTDAEYFEWEASCERWLEVNAPHRLESIRLYEAHNRMMEAGREDHGE